MPQQDWTTDIEAKRTQLRQSRHKMPANTRTTENYALHEYACLRAEQALLANRTIGREGDGRSWNAVMAKRQWLYRELRNADLEQARQCAADAAIDADGNNFYAAYAAYCCANQDIYATARDVVAAAACSLAITDSNALRDLAASPQPTMPTDEERVWRRNVYAPPMPIDTPPIRMTERAVSDADTRALQLLRRAGPEGEMLANQQSARVESRLFNGVVYVIQPDAQARIEVRNYAGMFGSICIQSTEDAPPADILLSKLRLCQADEARLWTVGNYRVYNQGPSLPSQLAE